MSDRVEEKREQQRVEDARLAAQKAEAKRASESGEFARQIKAKQTQNNASGKQDAKEGGARQRVNARTLAKSGMVNNTFAKQLGADGDRRLVKARDDAGRRQADAAAQGRLLARNKEKDGDKAGGQAGRSAPRRVAAKDDKKDSHDSREARREQLLAAHSGIASVMPSFGVAAQSTSGPTGTTSTVLRQMLDQIVASVRQGSNQHGFGIIQIDLKEDVLAGARLTFENSNAGVSLKVQTPDKSAAALLTAGSTATELSAALQGHGIVLRGLEVNGTTVLRS